MTTYILAAKRTPIGKFGGSLSVLPAPKLGSVAISEAVKASGAGVDDIEDVIMGQVLAAGVGQAPARQASIYADIPNTAKAVTVNKVCGSGLYAVISLHNQIRLGETKVGVAGGQESMSQVPYILEKARNGYRLGHGSIIDSLVKDGLWDPYDDIHMGNCAEICAKEFDLTRESQDAFAEESYKRSQNAWNNDLFKDEIVPLSIPQRKKDPLLVDKDEEPFSVSFEKMKTLRPAFQKDGTVTAANASTINDGAAALILADESYIKEKDVKPLAKIVGYTCCAHEPKMFTTAPIKSMELLLQKTGLNVSDIDLFEINEAFSVVPMVAIKNMDLDSAKVNVHGGAVSMGHPIGASGARILVTLINALKAQNGRRGIASICIGGGEAASMLVEIC